MRLTDIVAPSLLPRWLESLSLLRVFWTKRPLASQWSPRDHCLYATVAYRRRTASYTLCEHGSAKAALAAELPHLAAPEDVEPPPHRSASLLYFWRPPWPSLPANTEVEVEAAADPRRVEELAGDACRVQRESWGTCFKPVPGVHTVFLARLGGKPVAAAYYNLESHNIDWGVHVARRLWRRRIGTRILSEVLGYASERGDPWVSVVRVLGVRRPRPGDGRAVAFYRACRPAARLRVYRLAPRNRFTSGARL